MYLNTLALASAGVAQSERSMSSVSNSRRNDTKSRPQGRPRPNPLAKENERLRRENARLSARLQRHRLSRRTSRTSTSPGPSQGAGDSGRPGPMQMRALPDWSRSIFSSQGSGFPMSGMGTLMILFGGGESATQLSSIE
jgi:hypothetical protein